MACIVSMVKRYSGCTVRTLIRAVGDAADNLAQDALKAEVQKTLDDARINSIIEPVVLDNGDGEGEEDTPDRYIYKHSKTCACGSTLAFTFVREFLYHIVQFLYVHSIKYHYACVTVESY
jgi:hypothetical protein